MYIPLSDLPIYLSISASLAAPLRCPPLYCREHAVDLSRQRPTRNESQCLVGLFGQKEKHRGHTGLKVPCSY